MTCRKLGGVDKHTYTKEGATNRSGKFRRRGRERGRGRKGKVGNYARQDTVEYFITPKSGRPPKYTKTHVDEVYYIASMDNLP
jgi:hypothetical protein